MPLQHSKVDTLVTNQVWSTERLQPREPARYLVTLAFETADRSYEHSEECTNPAVGTYRLIEWQNLILDRIVAKQQKKAA